MAELGYGFAYRVLDAQHFGVPQRRRRVFVVGCLGDWRSAAKVLFESESLCRDITPRREKGKEIATSVENGIGNDSQSIAPYDTAGTLLARDYKGIDSFDYSKMAIQTKVYETHPADSRVKEMGDVCQTVTSRWGTGGGNVPIAVDTYNGTIQGNVSATLTSASGISNATGPKVMQHIAVDTYNGQINGDVTCTLTADATSASHSGPKAMQDMRVRRLTPMECERLQGFPDNYTNTPTSSDSTRYKSLGNSMAVPVMRWIGQRINNV
jgi:DNA (cytosine-5)-methyltransferase 1